MLTRNHRRVAQHTLMRMFTATVDPIILVYIRSAALRSTRSRAWSRASDRRPP